MDTQLMTAHEEIRTLLGLDGYEDELKQVLDGGKVNEIDLVGNIYHLISKIELTKIIHF